MMRALKGRGGLVHSKGVYESVRTKWVASVHRIATVQSALAKFTSMTMTAWKIQNYENQELKETTKHLTKMLDFLKLYSPFATSDPRLHSLTSGIVATESGGINCDEAEKVGL